MLSLNAFSPDPAPSSTHRAARGASIRVVSLNPTTFVRLRKLRAFVLNFAISPASAFSNFLVGFVFLESLAGEPAWPGE